MPEFLAMKILLYQKVITLMGKVIGRSFIFNIKTQNVDFWPARNDVVLDMNDSLIAYCVVTVLAYILYKIFSAALTVI